VKSDHDLSNRDIEYLLSEQKELELEQKGIIDQACTEETPLQGAIYDLEHELD